MKIRVMAVLALLLFVQSSFASAGIKFKWAEDTQQAVGDAGNVVVNTLTDIGDVITDESEHLVKITKGGAEFYGGLASEGAKYYEQKFTEGAEYYSSQLEAKFRGAAGYFLMETPKNVILVGEDTYDGAPIIYVNGIATHRHQAIENAEVLAFYLQRPVFLLHNKSQEIAIDLKQSIYDRGWPFGSAIWEPDEIINSLFFSQEGRILQANQTTRELTWILYHVQEPITIVAHSQGTLITRNAIFTVSSLLGKREKMQKDVYWAALGVPMGTSEILVKPNNFDFLVHVEDPVAGFIGFNSFERYDIEEHGACESYFPRLYNFNNVNTDFRLSIGAERSNKYVTDKSDCDSSKIPNIVSEHKNINLDDLNPEATSPIEDIQQIYNEIWHRNASEDEIIQAIYMLNFETYNDDIENLRNMLKHDYQAIVTNVAITSMLL
jgi:hypothetical protein